MAVMNAAPILGLSVPTFTLLHVIISLVGIATGLIALIGWLGSRRPGGWNAAFLLTTILTSVTGFFFRSTSFGPPHVLGVLSLIVLAVALYALYGARLAGVWRPVYVGTAVIALYFNVVVAGGRAVPKSSALHALAPTGGEVPFLVAQAVALILFAGLGIAAAVKFRPMPQPA
jgi:hypothetical protein